MRGWLRYFLVSNGLRNISDKHVCSVIQGKGCLIMVAQTCLNSNCVCATIQTIIYHTLSKCFRQHGCVVKPSHRVCLCLYINLCLCLELPVLRQFFLTRFLPCPGIV
uniref:Uncharacterized protein n=1 Tax=Cacopsylla melanoneura TaxID=428564 RepID=A0A8D8QXG9_9HEMI